MDENALMISVIIPCYNQGHYLRYALESVLAQGFGQWEAIVVNDGSTDSTATVVQEYSDARIRTIYQENAGLSAARNTAVMAAEGRYLAFLDADDEWEPEFLATCYEKLESESEIAGVFTRCRYIDPKGTLLPGMGGEEIGPGRVRSRLLEGGFFPPNAVMIRAAVLSRIGLFDTKLTSVEDWDLWLRISEWQSMRGLAAALARYRVYPGSMSTNTARMHSNRVTVLAKHFGSPDDDVSTWHDQKRTAYGFAFRATAFGYLRQGSDDLAWQWMEKAFIAWPPLLERLDTFYELACKDQPRGYRGQATLLDISANGKAMLTKLNSLWADAPAEIDSRRKIALGNAHLALGMLHDQAGNWADARNHLLKAIQANRSLLLETDVQKRLAKVSLLTPRLAMAIRHSLLSRPKTKLPE